MVKILTLTLALTLAAAAAASAGPASAEAVIEVVSPSETLSIGTADILQAAVTQGAGGVPFVGVWLKPGPAHDFALITQHAIRQQVAVIFCKRLMLAPTVEAPTTSGILHLPAGSAGDAEGMVRVLRGEEGCPPG